MFGRRKTPPPAPTPATSPPLGGGQGDERKLHPGHQAVLRHLAEREQSEPGIREMVGGEVLLDLVCRLVADERGVRIETLLAVLASCGGQECVAGVIETARPGATLSELDLTVVKGHDGETYVFGDPVNRPLVESPDSLLCLAFDAALSLGAPVTVEMIQEEMGTVASRVGTAEFERLDLPEEHMVDRPTEWVRVFAGRLREALDLYDVPPLRRATAFGYALQKALSATKDGIDPMIAATVILQCATRASKRLVPMAA